MGYKKIKFELKGTAPLLMHKFVVDAEEVVSKGKKDYGTALEQALEVAYFNPKNKKLYMPSTWISGAIRSVSSDYKSSKNKKKTIKSVIGGAVRILTPEIYFKDNKTTSDLELFSSPVVIQRQRIVRHRPKLDNWVAEVELLLDTDLVSVNELQSMVNDAGHRVGIGDFRISKGGPFGSFEIISIKEQDVK